MATTDANKGDKAKTASCAECTRLKKKCSKTWPCVSCVKRGCEDICPDSTTAPSRLGRAGLQRIRDLEAENRRLQDALALASASASDSSSRTAVEAQTEPDTFIGNGNGPRLQIPNTREKNTADNGHGHGFPAPLPTPARATSVHTHSSMSPASTLTFPAMMVPPLQSPSLYRTPDVAREATAIDKVTAEDLADSSRKTTNRAQSVGRSTTYMDPWLGRGAGAMHIIDAASMQPEESILSTPGSVPLHLPAFGLFSHEATSVDDGLAWQAFPSHEEAMSLLFVYFECVNWMYRPIDRVTASGLVNELYVARHSPAVARAAMHPHRLGLLAMVMALAYRFCEPDAIRARSAFRTINRMAEVKGNQCFNAAAAWLFQGKDGAMYRPSVAACQAMHLMVSFLLMSGAEDNVRAAWPLLGLQIRLCQSLGFHRGRADDACVDADDTLRILWWESYTYDLLQSLNFGRPYATPSHFVTCPKPKVTMNELPVEDAFHVIKYSMAETFAKVADCLSGLDVPDTQTIRDLDTELRALENSASPWLKFGEWQTLPAEGDTTPQRHMIALLKDKALLALHRPRFARALRCLPEPLLAPDAASFTACVSAARRHTAVMESILLHRPAAAYNWWFFPFHAFTAAIIQAVVLLRCPQSMVADDVRSSLVVSVRLFTEMEAGSRFAARALPILQRLRAQVMPAAPMHMSFAEPSLPTHPGRHASCSTSAAEVGCPEDDILDWFMAPSADVPQPQADENDMLMQTLLYWASNPDLNHVIVA